MSRSFAGVGVAMPPARLRQIASGAAVGDGELVEIKFALIAYHIEREERHAKFARLRRRCIRWLVIAGVVVAALNTLIWMAYVVFSVMQQSSLY